MHSVSYKEIRVLSLVLLVKCYLFLKFKLEHIIEKLLELLLIGFLDY